MLRKFFVLVFVLLLIGSVYAAWVVTTNPSTGGDIPYAIAVDATGVYITGSDSALGGANSQWAIEKRSLDDGSPLWRDTSDSGSGFDTSSGIDSDGTNLYVVGWAYSGVSNYEWRIEKRGASTGDLDTLAPWPITIDPDPTGNQDSAYDVAIYGSDIYVVGSDFSTDDEQWRIERRDALSGAETWVPITNNFGNREDIPFDISVDLSGAYIAGRQYTAGRMRWRIEKRLLGSGTLDWFEVVSHSANNEEALAITTDDSYVYTAGFDQDAGVEHWRIERRRKTDGFLEWEHWGAGPVPTITGRARGIAVDSSGVYVVGFDSSLGFPDHQWRVEKRRLDNGNLIWGETSNLIPGNEDAAYAISVDSSGIYVAGYDFICGESQWRIAKCDFDGTGCDEATLTNVACDGAYVGESCSNAQPATITGLSLNDPIPAITIEYSGFTSSPPDEISIDNCASSGPGTYTRAAGQIDCVSSPGICEISSCLIIQEADYEINITGVRNSTGESSSCPPDEINVQPAAIVPGTGKIFKVRIYGDTTNIDNIVNKEFDASATMEAIVDAGFTGNCAFKIMDMKGLVTLLPSTVGACAGTTIDRTVYADWGAGVYLLKVENSGDPSINDDVFFTLTDRAKTAVPEIPFFLVLMVLISVLFVIRRFN
ncbi:MAG: hypothetical protein ABID38_03550 [Candidatus Diapherotrites archaeon]